MTSSPVRPTSSSSAGTHSPSSSPSSPPTGGEDEPRSGPHGSGPVRPQKRTKTEPAWKYDCRRCGQTHTSWAAAQRHADSHHGARIEIALR